jgi:peptidoglycan biosynthesis protein MviN/MurJ (putative lipid II flippase)
LVCAIIQGVRARRSPETTATARRSAVHSGILTGVSTLVLNGSGAVAAAILAQKFGRDAATDGFLAAYGVYVTLTLAAQALRLTAVPELTRSEGAALGSYAAAILLACVPLTVLAWVFARPIGEALTGGLPGEAADLAAQALVWFVPAAVGQLLAALAAAALAARDRFVAPAVGFSLGGVAGVVVFVVLADEHGLIALAWGLAVNAAIALGVPLLALGAQLRVLRFAGAGRRLLLLAEAAAVPVALQALYVICLRLASALGVGSVTSFSYAYFFAAVLVAGTATSLAIISTAELTRRNVDPDEAVAHVVHGAWLSLVLIAGAAGVFALVGAPIASSVLGDAFSGDVGAELGRLVVALSPWMVASVGFSLAFPLLYVLERSRVLVPIAIGAVVVHVPVALALRSLWGLEGLAVALGISTLLVLGALLYALSARALSEAAVALVRVAMSVGAFALVTFGMLSLVADDTLAAVVGIVAYAGLIAVVRPRGLREAWGYVRELH